MKRVAKVIHAPVPLSAAPGMSPLLRWTLSASLGVHLILLSLHFELPKLFKAPAISPPLEVSLVNAKTASKPAQSDFLAQANLDGGGNTDEKRRERFFHEKRAHPEASRCECESVELNDVGSTRRAPRCSHQREAIDTTRPP